VRTSLGAGESTRACILAIGDELVDGRILDSNSQWLAAQLTALGIVVTAHLSEGDGMGEILSALDYAVQRADLILVTGGLGPTEDDRTREALALWSGQKLVENAEAWKSIQDYFLTRGVELAGSNRRQALLPETAILLPNQAGTAPGFVLESSSTSDARSEARSEARHEQGSPKRWEVFVLPGVPSEMRHMFETGVLPRIQDRGVTLVQRTLAFGGVSEARLGKLFADHLTEGGDLRVGMCAEYGLIRVTVRGYGEEARSKIDALFAELSRLGEPWVLGEAPGQGEAVGGLEAFLVREFVSRGMSLTLAESCTAGLAASRLGQVPGLSQVLSRAFITYSNEAKQEILGLPSSLFEEEGAVSDACARAMALAARRVANSDLAGAITGIAGPEGGSPEKPVGLVHLAVASRDRIWRVERRFGNPGRQIVRDRAATALLLLLLGALRGEGGEPLDSSGSS
jgi:PncC family amidohydrolase